MNQNEKEALVTILWDQPRVGVPIHGSVRRRHLPAAVPSGLEELLPTLDSLVCKYLPYHSPIVRKDVLKFLAGPEVTEAIYNQPTWNPGDRQPVITYAIVLGQYDLVKLELSPQAIRARIAKDFELAVILSAQILDGGIMVIEGGDVPPGGDVPSGISSDSGLKRKLSSIADDVDADLLALVKTPRRKRVYRACTYFSPSPSLSSSPASGRLTMRIAHDLDDEVNAEMLEKMVDLRVANHLSESADDDAAAYATNSMRKLRLVDSTTTLTLTATSPAFVGHEEVLLPSAMINSPFRMASKMGETSSKKADVPKPLHKRDRVAQKAKRWA